METVIGTEPYMAPEVFNERYNESSDVFSMGLVMFVICELPYNPRRTGAKLLPIVYKENEEHYLGRFLHTSRFRGQARYLNQKSTSLMNAMHCPSDERELFDSMLQYDYHDRPTASEVLEKLTSIEKQRREEAERKHREEEEAKRRLEAERRRREEAQKSWCWIL